MLHFKFRNKHLYLKIPMLNYDNLFICKQLVDVFLLSSFQTWIYVCYEKEIASGCIIMLRC